MAEDNWNGQKWLEMAKNVYKWLKCRGIAENGWKCQEMAGNVKK